MNSDLEILYKKAFKIKPEFIKEINSHSSGHKLFRLGTKYFSCLGVVNNNPDENLAFINFSETFLKCRLNVPKIYIKSPNNVCYLEEDLGNTSLYDYLKKYYHTRKQSVINYYKNSMEDLIKFQIFGKNSIDFSLCYQTKYFAFKQINLDLKKFMDYCLPPDLKKDFIKNRKREIIKILTEIISKENKLYFMYRDFQPRNIMIKDKRLYFIDYQSGRIGPLQYDPASFIYSGSIILNERERNQLFYYYINYLSEKIQIDKNLFIKNFYPVALIRILQMLGSYGFNYRLTGKQEFGDKVVNAFNNLNMIGDKIENKILFAYLKSLLNNREPVITHTLTNQ